MEFAHFQENDTTGNTGTQLHLKQEPESEFLDNLINEPECSVLRGNSSFQRIKDEVVIDDDVIETPCKKRRKHQEPNEPNKKIIVRNRNIVNGKNRTPEVTQLPCIINITPSDILERPNQEYHNGTFDTSSEMQDNSLQSSIPERIFAPNVYEILEDIQSTLKDLKAEIAETSKKLDQLQNCLPQPSLWEKTKSDFNFPISTDEQLLELEKQLENKEIANKLVLHLTSRTHTSWREMVHLCMKYILSRNVAVLYNLNGIKGTKKKFRDLNICNILVECVQYKFKEATTLEIFKRISLTLAGARDWEGSRHKKD